MEKQFLIERLQKQIGDYGKLPEDLLKKINYKFRLEWNYTSNSMEGNTLTIEETRSVMVGNITVEGKPLKDVLEMKGHDDIVSNILRIGKGELNISESRIRDIHKGIMYEDDVAKRDKIGKWKTQNNYVINYKGERNDFVEPADVPVRMHDLINWLNGEKERTQRKASDSLHPAIIAFKFHLDYINIHPFYDGNGRTARILMNLILVSYGLPPLYIKANEKNAYYQYLADIQGYGGDPDLFYDFMSGLLIRSMQLIINAVEGIEIEEPDDVSKDLEILRRKLGVDIAITKAPNLVYSIFDRASGILLTKFNASLSKFDSLFSDSRSFKYFNNRDATYETKTENNFNLPSKPRTVGQTKIWDNDIYEQDVRSLMWKITKFGLKGAKKNYNIEADIFIEFNSDNYVVNGMVDNIKLFSVTKGYDVQIDEDLSVEVCNAIGKHILATIKELLGQE